MSTSPEKKTILATVTAEIVVKKSRFICTLTHTESEEEALSFIESIKKKHYDARHNCSAFIIAGNPPLERSSDNGEPSGTAGKPMLDILNGASLENVCAVVTRYFGGTLLGTGGLVRAYSDALNEALGTAEFAEYKKGFTADIRTDYNGLGKLRYYASQNDIFVDEAIYGADVTVPLIIPENRLEGLKNYLRDTTSGKTVPENVTGIIYSDIGGKRLVMQVL